MKITYPTSDTRQFYERNPVPVLRNWLQQGVAPHVETSRGAYTVPTNRAGVLTVANLIVRRATAAAPVGMVKVFIQFQHAAVSCHVFTGETFANVVNDLLVINLGLQVWLAPGDILDIRSIDLGTGGTNDYQLTYGVMEFDA